MKNKLFIELYFLIQAYLIFIITITTLFRDILFSKRYKILVELPLLTTSMLDFLLFSRNLRFITEIRFEDTVAVKITWRMTNSVRRMTLQYKVLGPTGSNIAYVFVFSFFAIYMYAMY